MRSCARQGWDLNRSSPPDLLHKDQGCFSGSSGSILGLERERLLGIGMDSLKEFTAVLINS